MCHAPVVVVTAQRIARDAYPALSDALSVSYWRKQQLQLFLLAELASAPELLAGIDWTGQPKRASVGQLVGRLIASEHRPLERREQAAAADLAVFERKVSIKTHKTSGLYASMHGFSRAAVDKFMGVGTCLLLADGSDLVIVVEGRAAARRSTREFSVSGRSVRHITGLNLLGQGANGQQARCCRRLVVLEPGQMLAAQADRRRVGRCRSGLGGGWPGRAGGCNTMSELDASRAGMAGSLPRPAPAVRARRRPVTHPETEMSRKGT